MPKLTAIAVTQLRTGSTQIMRGNIDQPHFGRVSADHIPRNVVAETLSPNHSVLAYRTKYAPRGDTRC